MHDSKPPVSYSVPTESTNPKFAASFAKGCGGLVTQRDALEPGAFAFFGSLARWRIFEQARAEGRTWFYGDHAYFGRRHYYRITRNAMQHTGLGEPADLSLLKPLGVRASGWRRDGKRVLLCPNSAPFMAANGVDADQWVADVTAELRRHTDRPIEVRWKNSGGTLEAALEGTWAVVVYTSMSGAIASLAGVPCFATAPCTSASFGSMDLSRIERPVRPDNRAEMAAVLAANQWTDHEIRRGQAWAKLKA